MDGSHCDAAYWQATISVLVCHPCFSMDRICIGYYHGLGTYCAFHCCAYWLKTVCMPRPAQPSPAQPSPGDQDLIRDRQNRLLEEQRRRLEELKELPGKEAVPTAPSAPVDTRCFPIKDIELKGADSLSASERERLLKPYIGQCLGVSQLNELLKVITDYYIEKGLVTSRAYLPQQDLSAGHLKVLVVEGKLEGEINPSPFLLLFSRSPFLSFSLSRAHSSA